MEQALDQLEKQCGCLFSYNTQQLDAFGKIEAAYYDTPLSSVLEDITHNKFEIKQRSRYIMLIERESRNEPHSNRSNFIVEGFVRNAQTGETVHKATVYVVGEKYATLSDERGYYKLEMNSSAENVGLSYSKQYFFDTIVVVKPAGSTHLQNIQLSPREKGPEPMPAAKVGLKEKEVENLPMVRLLVSEKQRSKAVNLEFLERIPVQLSFLPMAGTNQFTSGFNTNIVSLNLIAGYNAGLSGVEMSAVMNILRFNMDGVQLAGTGNIVGGNVRGVQVAGAFNNVRGSVTGAQGAGIYNIVLDTVIGAQTAGVFNVLRGSINGAQLAGLFNVATENMNGLQGAGLFNYTKKDVKYGQLAGFMNLSRNLSGAQVSGFTNIASGDAIGLQISGFTNLCGGELNGTQIAGFGNVARQGASEQISGFINVSADAQTQVASFLNVGKTVKGAQVALINVSDSSAVQIGLLSFSAKGRHQVSFFADELQYLNVAFKTGTRKFYNIIQAGYGSYYGLHMYSYGYGFGLEMGPAENRVHLCLEPGVRQYGDFENNKHPLNLNIHLDPLITVKLNKKNSQLVFGPTFNLFVQTGAIQNTDPTRSGVLQVDKSYPAVFDPVQGVIELENWIGFKLGVSI